jgi:hypothetical protein
MVVDPLLLEFREEFQAMKEKMFADQQELVDSMHRILVMAENLATPQPKRVTRRPGLERATDPVAIRLSVTTVPEKTTRRPGLERAAHQAAIHPSAATVPEKTTRPDRVESAVTPVINRLSTPAAPKRTKRCQGHERPPTAVAICLTKRAMGWFLALIAASIYFRPTIMRHSPEIVMQTHLSVKPKSARPELTVMRIAAAVRNWKSRKKNRHRSQC